MAPAVRAEACAVALHPDELTETQLDVVCGSTGMLGGPRYIASDGGSSASTKGSVHWPDLPQEHAEAFPAYAAWYAATRLVKSDERKKVSSKLVELLERSALL